MKKEEIKKIILLFFIWRISLFIIAYLASFVLPFKPSFPYFDGLHNFNPFKFLYSFANFDGVHYLMLAEYGYRSNFSGTTQAFFPSFPVFIAFLNLFIKNFLVSGLLISNFAFLFFLFYLFYYLKNKWNVLLAWRIIYLVLLFPTSFYFASVYSESLFLLLLLLNLIYYQKKNFLGFFLTGFFLTATRVIGIFWPFALLVEMLCRIVKNKKPLLQSIKQNIFLIFIICSTSLGLISYMFYLRINFNDPFYFFTVQNRFGAGRQSQLVLFPQVIWRYLKMLITISYDWKFYAIFQELVISLLFLGLLITSLRRKYRISISWLLFSFLSYFLPTLTGVFSSMPRYVLVCFSGFFVLAQLKVKKKIFYSLLFISGIFLVLNLILFTQGYWVS